MSAADSAHHGSACIATTEHMPTPTLTEVEIRRTDGSLHTTYFTRRVINSTLRSRSKSTATIHSHFREVERTVGQVAPRNRPVDSKAYRSIVKSFFIYLAMCHQLCCIWRRRNIVNAIVYSLRKIWKTDHLERNDLYNAEQGWAFSYVI